MIEVAKGDIFFEPMEALVELLVRAVGRILARETPVEPLAQWGWPEWLWLAILVALIAFVVRYFMGRRVGAGR
jgi:hypothetical protein